MNAGQIIKAARKIRGYTLVHVSEHYGISESTIRNYEKGRTPIPKFTYDGLLKYYCISEEGVLNVV